MAQHPDSELNTLQRPRPPKEQSPDAAREACPRSLSGMYGRPEASGPSASGWVLPSRESDLWDFINLGTGKPQQDSVGGQLERFGDFGDQRQKKKK
ncbi:hypothetical protein LEMLEM_LOCUS25765, partial [Lemmus lemmus]